MFRVRIFMGKSPKEFSTVESCFLNRFPMAAAQEISIENFMCSGFGEVFNTNEYCNLLS
jgi:hypothetical protein